MDTCLPPPTLVHPDLLALQKTLQPMHLRTTTRPKTPNHPHEVTVCPGPLHRSSPPPSSENSTPREKASPWGSQVNGSRPTSTTKPSSSPSPTPTTAPSPSDPSNSQPANHATLDLALSLITETPDEPNRLDPDPEPTKALAASIAAIGLINPITVRPNGNTWNIVTGRRRLAAFRLLGRQTIPANVTTTHPNHHDTMKLAENVARSNLTPVEEAMQLAPLVTTHPQGVDGVALAIGRNVNWILDRLEICDWPDSLQLHVHNRKVTLAAAKRLFRIQPDELRETRIAQAAATGINARTAAMWLQDTQATLAPEAPPSEKSRIYEGVEIETETRVTCFLCREPTKIQLTVPMRVCNGCLLKLERETLQPPADQQT